MRLALLLVLCLSQVSFGQLFPNAPWNQPGQVASGDCPGGVCPDRGAASASHWTYPGTITNHLQGAHGVPTNGMSRQQMLDLHDSLHEGRAPAMKQSVPLMIASPYGAYSSTNPVAPYDYKDADGRLWQSKSYGSTGSASYGSSGSSFRVGSVLPDGSVVTSIGSTIDPAIAQAAEAGIQALGIGDRVKFRRALLQAARQARDAGEITAGQFFLLSAASRNPNVLEKMQGAVHEAAIEEGLATTQAPDWDGLISFIEKLIPLIIQLINLFG